MLTVGTKLLGSKCENLFGPSSAFYSHKRRVGGVKIFNILKSMKLPYVRVGTACGYITVHIAHKPALTGFFFSAYKIAKIFQMQK